MDSRTIAYALATVMLVAARFVLPRRDSHAPDERAMNETHASLSRLLLASFLVLFAELAFIRWIAVEARVFAYFKNLALLLCFLGFGMGCALRARPTRWPAAVKALFGLLLVVRLPYLGHRALEGLSQSLGASADMHIWAANPSWNLFQFLGAGALAALLFLLIVFVFVPLGQVVSRQMDLSPRPLAAYS